MTAPKETNKAPISDAQEMEIQELSHEKFRIILLKKRPHRQLNKFKRIIHEQKKLNKCLELKNKMTDLKN